MLLLEHFGMEVPLQEKTLQDICLENDLNTELVLTFANLYNGANNASADLFSHKDVLAIVNYLQKSHRYYSEEIYPNILSTIRQMSLMNHHKEMVLVEKFFMDYMNEVTEHLNYENEVVFPYARGLFEQMKNESPVIQKSTYAVSEYKEHHNDIEEKLDDLRNLLLKYLPQENDQVLRRKVLFSLYELEYDLNIHSQIEDLILIPLVTSMEKQLKVTR